ncbi:MAG: hypothetical protein ACTSVO_15280 [Candidatus Heimdallarchaeaceae archaeon]
MGKKENNMEKETAKTIYTKSNREYLKLIQSQGILVVIFLLASLIELIFLRINQENFEQRMNIILAVFAGAIICFIGLVVYIRPIMELFNKIRLDEKQLEVIETTKIRKTSIALILYKAGIILVLGGMIYVVVSHFITAR